MAGKSGGSHSRRPRRSPATTSEARENQLIALAEDVAEHQLENGIASAQVITHYLKLGTTRERLEQERLRQENLLMQAKIEQLKSSVKVEEMYAEALAAMKAYSGQAGEEDVYTGEELYTTAPDS